MTIEPMQERDREAVHALLRSHKLPLDGLDDHVSHALVARDASGLVGSAALEVYGPYALLRSVAVDESLRGQGVGQLLTAEVLALARRLALREVFLLTETAAGFFPKFGFEPIARTGVPPEVRQSVEFRSACPASALAMRLRLTPDLH
jgi:amino-acid N-acetyltransferase